jgi:uncharacterized Fe-S cluster-containing radical SAM superfamily protein
MKTSVPDKIDPIQRGNEYRKLMMKIEAGQTKFLISEIAGTKQETDTPIFHGSFRVREYIKTRDSSDWMQKWQHASFEEVLSPTFLGLDDSDMQKLEFQNPAYVAAFRLGGDPRDYNNVFTVQVTGCCYECSFCYVPRELNNPTLGHGSFFSAREILDTFEEARRDYSSKGIAVNVIRLSGGEVTTLVPELITNINLEINQRNMSRSPYLWVDTNLSSTTHLEPVESELKVLARQRNIGFVGCLKAVGNRQTGSDDFSTITGASPKFFETQFGVLDYFVNEIKADFYVYILPIVLADETRIRNRFRELFDELRAIHKNLPLRTNMLTIHEYTPTKTNLEDAKKEGRPLNSYGEKSSFVTWYRILKENYPSNELMRYRCQVPLS